MNHLFLFGLLACFIVDVFCGKLGKDGILKVTIVTTAGNTDTAKFLSSPEFQNTYKTFSDFLEIEFIPVGRIVRGAEGQQICQHGFEDYCEANDYQRCTLSLLSDNIQAQVNYMICAFEAKENQLHLSAEQHITKCLTCAESAGTHVRDVLDCANSSKGKKLAQQAEDDSAAVREVIKYAPAIMFEDVIDEEINRKAFKDFPFTVCRQFVLSGADRCRLGSSVLQVYLGSDQ